MTDDELRAGLRAAHQGDAPPSFAEVLARPRRRPRARGWRVGAGFAALAAATALLLWPRPAAPPPAPLLAEIDLRWSAPLDFLLDVPGDDLLRAMPRFDTKGILP